MPDQGLPLLKWLSRAPARGRGPAVSTGRSCCRRRCCRRAGRARGPPRRLQGVGGGIRGARETRGGPAERAIQARWLSGSCATPRPDRPLRSSPSSSSSSSSIADRASIPASGARGHGRAQLQELSSAAACKSGGGQRCSCACVLVVRGAREGHSCTAAELARAATFNLGSCRPCDVNSRTAPSLQSSNWESSKHVMRFRCLQLGQHGLPWCRPGDAYCALTPPPPAVLNTYHCLLPLACIVDVLHNTGKENAGSCSTGAKSAGVRGTAQQQTDNSTEEREVRRRQRALEMGPGAPSQSASQPDMLGGGGGTRGR